MKKIISLILTLMLLSVTAFASDAEELAELYDKNSSLNSASVEITMSVEKNKPLDIISQIPDIGEDEPYSPQLIAESLLDTKITLNASYSVSDDHKKMLAQMSMVCDAPITINDDLKIAAWTRFGMWLEYDFTDPQKPVYKSVIKTPFDNKYIVNDMSEYYAEHPELLESFSSDTIKELRAKTRKAVLDNAEITKENGIYTVKFSGSAAQNYIKDAVSAASESILGEALKDAVSDIFTDGINDFLGKVNIFGDKGITMTFKADNNGYITSETEEINIDFNMYDAIKAFDGSTEGLDRAKADIDLSIKTECVYSEHNSAKSALPELTENNSYVTNYSESGYYSSYRYDDNGIEMWADYDAEEPVLIKDNVIYFPYEDMARQIGLDIKTTVNGDTFTISCGEQYSVDVKNEITVEDETWDMDIPMIISDNGRWYCTKDFLWDVGISTYDISYDMETNSLTYRFYYHGLPETDSDDYEEYNPYIDKRYYYVDSDRPLYIANDTAYVPIYDLLNEISYGEYSFGVNGFEYTAQFENPLGINTVSVYTGDRFVTVNGNKVDLPCEVVEIDGVMRVPVSFAESVGLELNRITVDPYGHGSSFRLRRAIENDTDYDIDYDDYYNRRDDNWFYNLFN